MPIKNFRRLTTLNVQSDPVGHGNNLGSDPQGAAGDKNVSIVYQDQTTNGKDPLSDNNQFSFSSIKRSRTRRKQASSYSIAKNIPSSSFSRTSHNLISPSLSIRDFSDSTLYNPHYNKAKKEIAAKSSKSEVKIGSMWGMNRYLLESSISNLRPEIIASFDWMPARSTSGRKGWIESLIEFRWAMRMLQIENVEETIKRLKDVDLGGAYSRLESKYEYYVDKEQEWLEWREKILQTLNSARLSLDIKDNETRLKGTVSKYYSEKFPQKSQSSKSASLKDLFTNELSFSEDGYERFSNSKVYGQIIYDLYYACRYHSPLLITSKGHRDKDLNSTTINTRIIPKSKNYKFRLWQLGNSKASARRAERKFDATQYKDYNKVISDLPSDESDRIKVLVTSLSNELIVSSGIGYLADKSLGKRFNVDLFNPLWYPLGRVRKNIMTDGWPRGSLSSLVLLEDSSKRLILPFETRDFSDTDGKTAVAGSKALVDGIMRFGLQSDGLDYEPYYKFGKELDETSQDVAAYLDDLMNMSDTNEMLHPKSIYTEILTTLLPCISGICNENSKNEQQLTIASLMNLASENPRVRHTMLRYILELRDARDQLVTDTGNDDFLIPDADNPPRKPPNPRMQLARFGKFKSQQSLSSDTITKRYGLQPDLASKLIEKTSQAHREYSRAKKAAAKEEASRKKDYYRLSRNWQRTSLWLSLLSRNAIDDQRRPPQETNTRSIVKISDTAVVSMLRKSATGYSSYYSPFSHILKLARRLQVQASNLADRDNTGGEFLTGGKLSRYNGWDENALITVIFEIYCSLFSRFIDAEMVGHGSNLYVKYNPETNARVRSSIVDTLSISRNSNDVSRSKQLAAKKESLDSSDDIKLTSDMMEGKLSVLDALQSASNQSSELAVFSDIYSFVESFEKELEFKALMISHLQAIGNNLGRSADKIKIFFNTKDEDLTPAGTKIYKLAGRYVESSRIRRYMAWKTKTSFGRDILRSMTEHQVALQRVAAVKLSRKDGDMSYLPSEMIIESEEIAALKSFLAAPEMRGVQGGNIRVMTVGIPSETIDILQNPPYTIGRKNSEAASAKDTFEVHVHKRDLEYEDIIFKPKKFEFDRSIFLMPDAFSSVAPATKRGRRKYPRSWNFDQVVKRCKFTMASYAGLQEKSAVQLYKSARYSNIPESKRTQLISNHVANRLLHLYYRLINGMTMDENTFLKDGDWGQLLVDQDAGKLLQLSQMAGETKNWIYTGTVPVGNLLIGTKIQSQNRTRIATFKDAEIFARPTITQLSRLARDLRIARYGYLPAYKRYRKVYTTGEVYQVLGKRAQKRQAVKYNRAIEKAKVVIQTNKFSVRANPSSQNQRSLESKYWTVYGRIPNEEHPVWKRWISLRKEWSTNDATRLATKAAIKASRERLKSVRARLDRMVIKKKSLRDERDSLKATIKRYEKTLGNCNEKAAALAASKNTEFRYVKIKIRRNTIIKVSETTKGWNKQVKKYNKAKRKENREIKKKRSKLAKYQRKAFKHIARRFYRKKPKLQSVHLQNFRMICSSSILGPCAMINKVLAPRTFDRVLMIPVDPDGFEIDMKATKNLLRKKTIEEREEFKDMTDISFDQAGKRVIKLKPRRRGENYSSFNDFFVTISTITTGEDS
jgi:hypothetical protein